MKNYIYYTTLLCLTLLICFSCSSDDEDDFGHKSKYSFVSKTYIRQYTATGTSEVIQHRIHFITDSTFSYASYHVTKEKYTAGPTEGRYVVDGNGSIIFSGVRRFNIHVWNRRLTLRQGKFNGDNQKKLNVYCTIEYDTGRSDTDWSEYKLEE